MNTALIIVFNNEMSSLDRIYVFLRHLGIYSNMMDKSQSPLSAFKVKVCLGGGSVHFKFAD